MTCVSSPSLQCSLFPSAPNILLAPRLGVQLVRLHALELKLAPGDNQRSQRTVLSIPLAIWSHGKNLSRQYRSGQRFRLFYLDPLPVDPSAPLVYLEDMRGEMDPVIITRGEVTSFKLPPIGTEDVFEINCSALPPSSHYVCVLVAARFRSRRY